MISVPRRRKFRSSLTIPKQTICNQCWSLNLGLTYAQLATLEERTNPAESRKYMDLAQDLFRSLGWRDCSEDALKDAAQKQYEIWNSKPKKAYP